MSDLSTIYSFKETRNTFLATALLWFLIPSPSIAQTLFATIGAYGNGSASEGLVSGLVHGWNPDFIITMGDNHHGSTGFDSTAGQFYCDSLTDAGNGAFCAGGNSLSNAFFPSLGNHDYTDGTGLNGYLDYFTLPGSGVATSGTSGNERFYDFINGPVHFFVLDSQGALNSAPYKTAQFNWLQAQLAASSAPWKVVYFHHTPYSSALHGSTTEMQWPFASWGANAVISGHDRTYERILTDGIVYFVNGLGGHSIYNFNAPVSGSQVRYNDEPGAMRVAASVNAITFEFINVSGSIIDTYTIEAGISDPARVDVRIAENWDDVEERLTGTMYFISSDLELGNDPTFNGEQTVGLRFQNVNIPQGATITAAFLEFETKETGSSPATVTIAAEANDTASPFTSTNHNLAGRPPTLASVEWNIPAWDTIDIKQQSPDLSTVVQEVIDRGGWNANNSLAFIITGSGTRTAKSYDGEPVAAPLLHVEYKTAAFAYSCTNLDCNFTDTSTNSGDTVSSWSWDFGDEGSSSMSNPSYAYAAAGTYNVTLTVTDNDSGSNSITHSVTITAPNLPPAAPTNLTVSVQSTGVQLNWSDNSSNEDSFIIERCEKTGNGQNETCDFSEIATVGANITSFFDSPSPDSSTYKYRVKANNGQGDSALITSPVKSTEAGAALQPWDKNPWYWSHQGKPVLLLGGSDDDNLFQWPEKALQAQLDRLANAEGNVIRNTMSDRNNKGFEVRPFQLGTNGKYDLDQWNVEYWTRFERLLQETAKRGIIVQIEIWDRFDYTDSGGRDGWQTHPYNPNNNVNYDYEQSGFVKRYPDHPGKNKHPFFFTTPGQHDNRVVLQYQERFVDKMLDHALQYDHVLYCMDNETSADEEWGRYWADYVKRRANKEGRQVFVTEMWDDRDLTAKNHKQTFDHPETYDFVDISQNNSNHGQKHWDNAIYVRKYISGNPRPINTTKTYGADGNTYGNDQDAIERFWRHLLAGAASIRFHRPEAGLGLNNKALATIRAARKLESIIPLWSVKPANNLLSDRGKNEAYITADAGRFYAAYFPVGGKVQVDISAAKGPLVAHWIDIESGEWGPTQSFGNGDKITVAAPSKRNWAVAIVAQ